VKSMTWNVLPAAPWPSPGFRRRERVGQAGAAPAAVGLAAPVAGTGLAAGLVAGPAGEALTVIVLVGAAAGLPLLPQPAASAGAPRSAAAARSRRSGGGDEVIGRFFLPRRLREPYD
jgi:hypothetical protein